MLYAHICTALISQLQSDGHISSEEAVKLASKKLFDISTPKYLETTMLPAVAFDATHTVTSSNGSVLSYADTITCIAISHDNVVNVTSVDQRYEDSLSVPLQSSYSNYESVNSSNASEKILASVSSTNNSLTYDLEDNGQVSVAIDNTIQPSVTSLNIEDTNVKEITIYPGTAINEHMSSDTSLVKIVSENAQPQNVVVAKVASNHDQEVCSVKGKYQRQVYACILLYLMFVKDLL